MNAYALLFQWFTQTTGPMIQEEVKKAMMPSPLGSDEKMTQDLENWERLLENWRRIQVERYSKTQRNRTTDEHKKTNI